MGYPSIRPVRCLVAAALLVPVYGDLPVHCLRHQVAGDWEFTLSPLGAHRSSCGHKKPDSQYNQPALNFLSSLGATTALHVSLKQPDTLETDDGSTGTWTMIYDEGFEMTIGNMVYFAFSDFEYKVDPVTKSKGNVSHCDATQIGWYHDKARTAWGCYLGRKKTSIVPPDATVKPAHSSVASLPAVQRLFLPSADPADQDVSDDDSTQKASFASVGQASAGFDQPMPNQWQQSVADAVNFLQLGWTAQVYDSFQGKTPRELNKYAGVRRSRPKPKATVAKQSQFFQSFLGLRSSVHRTSRHHSFDWRKHKGKNWLTPVVEQGDCGSCYTISTVHMLTARNKIIHNDVSEPSFSVSFPLYCSEYNQGCDGGYGFLQTKWSEDVGLIPESCAPFSQGGSSCHQALGNCDLGAKRYRASNHHYVGGYYGGSDAENIRKELVANGPLVMSFEPREDFMYYKDGVYKSAANKIHQEWQQVDHAVLLVGVGTDKGKHYWTMQNSWGTDWGENGYFRMDRGNDESGCESIVVAAEVVTEEGNPVLDALITSV